MMYLQWSRVAKDSRVTKVMCKSIAAKTNSAATVQSKVISRSQRRLFPVPIIFRAIQVFESCGVALHDGEAKATQVIEQ